MSRTDAFVGIDVAFAKGKRLPICICTVQAGHLVPLSMRTDCLTSHPRGKGNKAALDPTVVDAFAREVSAYLRRVELHLGVNIRRIALDAPSSPKGHGNSWRECEAAFIEHFGVNAIFKTPGLLEFEDIRAKAIDHLRHGGTESTLPNANRLWMLAGFALFQQLKADHWECIEVYPHATVRVLGAATVHKRNRSGVLAQLGALAYRTGWPSDQGEEALAYLARILCAPAHDAVDAYASAWIASLDRSQRHPLGCEPDDAIWIPLLDGRSHRHQ